MTHYSDTELRYRLLPGTRVFLGSTLADGTFWEQRCEIRQLSGLSVQLKPLTAPASVHPLEGATGTISYASRGLFYSFSGICSGDTRQPALKIEDCHQPQNRRNSDRFESDLCYAYRSLGILEPEEIERCWRMEQTRIEHEAALKVIAGHQGYSVLGWRNKGEVASLPVNISSSGMRFLGRDFLEPQTLIFLYLLLPFSQQRPLPAIARIVRSKEVELTKYMNPRYEDQLKAFGGARAVQSAAEFIKINPNDQAVLLNYLRLNTK